MTIDELPRSKVLSDALYICRLLGLESGSLRRERKLISNITQLETRAF